MGLTPTPTKGRDNRLKKRYTPLKVEQIIKYKEQSIWRGRSRLAPQIFTKCPTLRDGTLR